jgi:hypothetical protein
VLSSQTVLLTPSGRSAGRIRMINSCCQAVRKRQCQGQSPLRRQSNKTPPHRKQNSAPCRKQKDVPPRMQRNAPCRKLSNVRPFIFLRQFRAKFNAPLRAQGNASQVNAPRRMQ